MPLSPSPDAEPAAWLQESDLPWQRLVTFGAGGFEAYARLRFVPDPTRAGQGEVESDRPPEHVQLRSALDVLARHTTTPDHCWFCFWDGWGVEMAGARVTLSHRAYFLLHGAAADLAGWDGPNPAFVWPTDSAWCLADDVDPHYAGIGASPTAIRALTDTEGLDVVPADPGAPQPAYY